MRYRYQLRTVADLASAAAEERRLLASVATLAGFGCACDGDCAYAIVAGPGWIGLPRVAGVEALERFERLISQTRIGSRTRFGSDSRYWCVQVDAPVQGLGDRKMTFEEVRRQVEAKFPHAPGNMDDGVRTVPVSEIPLDAEAEAEGAVISVRVPLAHHTRPHQGWLFGAWSR